MSRCDSVRIASILPTCAFPFSYHFRYVCNAHPKTIYFDISTPRYVYWSAIGNSSSPHFHLKVTGFTLSSLHAITAHFFTFAVTLYILVHSINGAFSVSAILRSFLISLRNHLQLSIPTAYLPAPCLPPLVLRLILLRHICASLCNSL